jgi:hypothetical protein
MLKLIRFLFTGSWHEHIYVPVEQFKCSNWSSSYASRPSSIVHTYVSRCSCGKIQSKQVSV